MKKTMYRKPTNKINTQEQIDLGQSIEEKVRVITESGAPIESISPMVYTERKEGVRPDTNIRTDKWDVAQAAMDSISRGIAKKREEALNAKAGGNPAPSATETTTEK